MPHKIEVTCRDDRAYNNNSVIYWRNGYQIEWKEYSQLATDLNRVNGSDWTDKQLKYTEFGFLVQVVK